MTDTTDPYPEHTKLAAVRDKSQAIGEFLDWLLNEKGYHIAHYAEPYRDHLSDARIPIQTHLARFFGIDEIRLEQEKVAMLEAQRRLNEETTSD